MLSWGPLAPSEWIACGLLTSWLWVWRPGLCQEIHEGMSLAMLEAGFAGGAALFQLKVYWLGTVVLEIVAFPTAFEMRNQKSSRLESSSAKAVNGSLNWQKENVLQPSDWWAQELKMKTSGIKKNPPSPRFLFLKYSLPGQHGLVEWKCSPFLIFS